MKLKTIQFLVYYSLTAFAGVAVASGNHQGGHGHTNNDEGIGKPGITTQISRTVTIEMNDEMRFVPDNLTFKRGETVKFLVKNLDDIDHEFVLGTEKQLKEHYELMKRFPEMEHEDPNLVRVPPSQVGEVVWHFNKSGKILFGCLIPGHYDAGMKGVVMVKATSSGANDLASE